MKNYTMNVMFYPQIAGRVWNIRLVFVQDVLYSQSRPNDLTSLIPPLSKLEKKAGLTPQWRTHYLFLRKLALNEGRRLFLMMHTVKTVTTMIDANTTRDISKALEELDLESWTVGSSEWDPGDVLSRTAEM